MKKTLLLISFLVSIAILTTGCTYSQKEPQQTNKQVSPAESESVAATGIIKEFSMTAKKWEFKPSQITVNKGDTVKLHIESIDVKHGFGLSAFGVNENLSPGKTVDVEFVADRTGTFTFACTVFCGSGHSGMKGQLIVKSNN